MLLYHLLNIQLFPNVVFFGLFLGLVVEINFAIWYLKNVGNNGISNILYSLLLHDIFLYQI